MKLGRSRVNCASVIDATAIYHLRGMKVTQASLGPGLGLLASWASSNSKAHSQILHSWRTDTWILVGFPAVGHEG